MDSNVEKDIIIEQKVKVEDKKESSELKKLITKVDNRVKTKVLNKLPRM
jgi:hypothetical protein